MTVANDVSHDLRDHATGLIDDITVYLITEDGSVQVWEREN